MIVHGVIILNMQIIVSGFLNRQVRALDLRVRSNYSLQHDRQFRECILDGRGGRRRGHRAAPLRGMAGTMNESSTHYDHSRSTREKSNAPNITMSHPSPVSLEVVTWPQDRLPKNAGVTFDALEGQAAEDFICSWIVSKLVP